MAVRLVLPVLLTVGLSAGALLGVTLRQPNLLTAGAGGDSSGAGGALVILVTAAMSFAGAGGAETMNVVMALWRSSGSAALDQPHT